MNPSQRVLAIATTLLVVVTATWLATVNRRDRKESPQAASVPRTALANNRQRDIWDAEHTTFEIERRFGPAFLDALRRGDRQRLAAFASADFHGNGLAATTSLEREHAGIHERIRQRSPGQDPPVGSRLTADAIAGLLLSTHGGFRDPVDFSLRVLQISRAPQPPRSWTARVLLTSRGRSPAGQQRLVASEHAISGIIADGRQLGSSPWLTRWSLERIVERTGPAGLFQEITAEWNLDSLPIADNWNLSPSDVLQYRFQLAVADFNRDGHLDLAVASLSNHPLLLAGKQGRGFQDVAAAVRLHRGQPRERLENLAAAWIDYDNDGWPDLILGDRLYHNQQGRRFIDATRESGLGFLPECMGCLVADYDADGRLDLYVIYQKPLGRKPSGQEQWINETDSGLPNQLWRNMGHGRFRDVTDTAHADGGRRHTHAGAWFFLDDDHFPDLYLANDFGHNVILRNRGDGSFDDVSEVTGANGFSTSMGVATGDLDNDGRTDIYVANMYSKMGRRIIAQVGEADYPPGIYRQIQGSCAGNRLYRGVAGSRFEEISQTAGVNAVGWAYAPVLADFDNDGRLDVYATTGFLSFDRTKPDG
ncbi:MAG: VCBS repeat-containing protein [Planctomycetaceae bacterium]|jgi:hypothetical protein|nr:VCBS repeat-containing protein [Planctomycetaceae bacterium]